MMIAKSLMTALTIAASGGLMWVGTAASAATGAASASSDEKAEAAASRRVCRRVNPTGSRLPERICRTQREWDEIAQRNRNDVEAGRRNPEARLGAQ